MPGRNLDRLLASISVSALLGLGSDWKPAPLIMARAASIPHLAAIYEPAKQLGLSLCTTRCSCERAWHVSHQRKKKAAVYAEPSVNTTQTGVSLCQISDSSFGRATTGGSKFRHSGSNANLTRNPELNDTSKVVLSGFVLTTIIEGTCETCLPSHSFGLPSATTSN